MSIRNRIVFVHPTHRENRIRTYLSGFRCSIRHRVEWIETTLFRKCQNKLRTICNAYVCGESASNGVDLCSNAIKFPQRMYYIIHITTPENVFKPSATSHHHCIARIRHTQSSTILLANPPFGGMQCLSASDEIFSLNEIFYLINYYEWRRFRVNFCYKRPRRSIKSNKSNR